MDELLKALSAAFWVSIMEDLAKGDEDTRLWLDTGTEPTGFLWWCEVTGKDDSYPTSRWRLMLLRLWDMRGTPGGWRALKKLKEVQ